MKAVASDVHGNLESLEAVLADVRARGVDTGAVPESCCFGVVSEENGGRIPSRMKSPQCTIGEFSSTYRTPEVVKVAGGITICHRLPSQRRVTWFAYNGICRQLLSDYGVRCTIRLCVSLITFIEDGATSIVPSTDPAIPTQERCRKPFARHLKRSTRFFGT
jgi:hypothetical protein